MAAMIPPMIAIEVAVRSGGGAAARATVCPVAWLLGPLFPPFVETTAIMVLEAAENPAVFHVSVSVLV
jgi:hypothetical protein